MAAKECEGFGNEGLDKTFYSDLLRVSSDLVGCRSRIKRRIQRREWGVYGL
jgi:hypothetical protein